MNAPALRDVELTPRPAARMRVVGPGRRERAYLERVRELEQRSDLLGRELDVSRRLERGCQRLIDRLEDRADADRERLAEAEQAQKRLVLALGALQRDNELLRERLALAGPAPARLSSGDRATSRAAARRRRTWLDRLLGRSAAPRA
jgi:hypothetical protein